MPQEKRLEEIANKCMQDFSLLANLRGIWEIHWQEIDEIIRPNNTRFKQTYSYEPGGYRKTEHMVESTGMLCLTKFASVLMSMTTPEGQRWHSLASDDTYLDQQRDARLWYDQVTKALFKYRYAPQANFTSQAYTNYMDLGALGTCCLFIDKLSGGTGIRYKAIDLKEVFFGQNHQNIPDKVYRNFKLTAREAWLLHKSGEWPMLDPSWEGLAKSNPEGEYFFLHAVYPNAEANMRKIDFRGMAYSSYYIDQTNKHVVSEGGFETLPYVISRYNQYAGETWGRSPAMDALPELQTLNAMALSILRQGHKTTDPVMFAFDDGQLSSANLNPGAMNFGGVDEQGRMLIHPMPVGNLAITDRLLQDNRNKVKEIFLLDLFQILVDSPRMTATEVVERIREKGIFLGPALGRQTSEYTGPTIAREIDLLIRQRLIPPPPPVVREAFGNRPIQYKVKYESPLARAQRAEEVGGIMRVLELGLQVQNVTQDPTAMRVFNTPKIMKRISYLSGIEEDLLYSDEEVEARKQADAEQAQVQQAIAALPGIADMTKAEAAMRKATG